jgi:hypothetical protein
MTKTLLSLSFPGTDNLDLPSQISKINPDKDGLFGSTIIGWALGVLFAFGVAMALLFVVYGGIKWIMSEGDPKNIETARNTIIYSLIGLAIISLSALIVNTLGKFFGVSFL